MALPAFLRLCALCWLLSGVLGLHLGAFNVKRLGPTKAAKDDVMGVLAKIAARYDIVLIQEITDASGEAIQALLQRIEQDHGIVMSMNISDRLGRTSQKEEYAFLYRKDLGISVLDSIHFDDGDEKYGNDTFQREPYIVRFHATNCKVTDFTLIALHTMPSATVDELKALTDVVEFVRDSWAHEQLMVLGDLNADCSYVAQKYWPEITIRQDPDYWWPIGDDVDTTVKTTTDCAYDRFIVSGDRLRNAVVSGSAGTFDFQQEYGLSYEQALDVSDHFPIELRLKEKFTTIAFDLPGPGSRASDTTQGSLLDALQHLWRAVVKKLSRRRSGSDL